MIDVTGGKACLLYMLQSDGFAGDEDDGGGEVKGMRALPSEAVGWNWLGSEVDSNQLCVRGCQGQSPLFRAPC